MAYPEDTRDEDILAGAMEKATPSDTEPAEVTPEGGSSEESEVTPVSEGTSEPKAADNWETRARYQQSRNDQMMSELQRARKELDDLKKFISLATTEAEMKQAQASASPAKASEEFDPYDPQAVGKLVTQQVQAALAQERQRNKLEQLEQEFLKTVPGATRDTYRETIEWAQQNVTPVHLYQLKTYGDRLAEAAQKAQVAEQERLRRQAEAVQKTPPSVAGVAGDARPKKLTPEEKDEKEFLDSMFKLDHAQRAPVTFDE